MKSLAIDCRSITKTKTGVGNVLINILMRLNLDEVTITLFFDSELDKQEETLFKSKGYSIELLKCKNPVLWEQILLPIKMKDKYDYVWFPANTGSVFIKAKKIATIHDVIFEKSLKEIPLSGKIGKDLARLYRKIFARILAKTAVRIYTVSEYSKFDILNSYNINEDKVKVIYNGLDSKYNTLNNENLNKENYLLSFGSNEPRKNTELMIKVYSTLLKNYNDMNDIKLILYGFRGYEESNAKKLIKELKLENNIKVYQYITDEMLLKLYRKAKIFCFLSSFEGFGLPIIESMSQGTPVVALDNSSITEIVGDSGILVKNQEASNIANEIHNLYNDSNSYNDFVNKGLENIKRFNWDISVKSLNKDFEFIIKNK
jgi:glycosyltransferase involved in cell wall biosynthesis